MARKTSGACPVDLKVSKSQTTHALCLLLQGVFSGSRVSGNHLAHSNSNFKQTFSFKWSLLGKKGRREGCGHWKENPFLPTRFMHHPTKKEGCTNFSLSVAVICFYDDGKSISTIKLFPCFFFKISSALSLWILLQQPLVTKLDATCCTKVTIEDVL